MPFIITTRRPVAPDVIIRPERITATARHAVTTLQAAISFCNEQWPDGSGPVRDYMLTEAGGTVGPLSDGTVIDVAPCSYGGLRTSLRRVGVDVKYLVSDAEIVAAYNAKGAASWKIASTSARIDASVTGPRPS